MKEIIAEMFSVLAIFCKKNLRGVLASIFSYQIIKNKDVLKRPITKNQYLISISTY